MSVDLDRLGAAVEREVMTRNGKRAGDEIIFQCPNPDHPDEHPSARYRCRKRAYLCDVCEWSGGLLVGDHPLAPALGLDPDHFSDGNGRRRQKARNAGPSRCPEPPENLTHRDLGRPAASWRLRDPDGHLVAVHCRFPHPDDPSRKTLRWWRGDWNLGGMSSKAVPLYGCDRLDDPQPGDDMPVIVVEGEPACDALLALGLPAVATVCGAKHVPLDAVLEVLRGRDVVLWSDADEDGRKHMRKLAEALLGVAARVRIWEPDGMPSGGDAVEWTADHADAPDIVTLLLETIETGASELDEAEEEPARRPLEFLSFAELAERVDSAGPRRWLLAGIWPAGDYGIHAAEQKAQKTWNSIDLAVAVASGTPWLGQVDVGDPGPVLTFAGEGGEANIVRRIRAAARERPVTAEDLPITVCTRAPHLTDDDHLQLAADEIDTLSPRLVIIDPLYLAAGGVSLADLYEMGAVLERIQHLCQDAGASLWIVTHHNRRQGRGPVRITGAGPAEWGRVLISGEVVSRRTDPETKATDVLTELGIVGGEIPDQTLRVRRRIWADDPDDLDSPLHLETTVTEGEPDGGDSDDLSPAARKLLKALEAVGPASGERLVDWIADKYGHGLRRETVSRELNGLADLGLIDGKQEKAFAPKTWWIREGIADAPV